MSSILVLLTMGFAATLATPEPPVRCSLIPFATGRDSATTYFIGRALPDTALAGPTSVRSVSPSGDLGRSSTVPAFGQVVRVERLAGRDSAALDGAFSSRGTREVVVVPWEYDPTCDPLVWSRSARWVADTTAGVYRVQTRPQSLWVDGRPVADAFHAALEPYPQGRLHQPGYRVTEVGQRGPWLTPDEYFELFSFLPERRQVIRDRDGARGRLAEWERTHPHLAGRYPATEILRLVRGMLNR